MKVAFLDRDGVINKEVNYLHKLDDFEYTSNCLKGMKNLNSLGFSIVIITNQAGIAKGIFSIDEFQKLTNWILNDLAKNGIEILDHLYCPHHPLGVIEEYAISCNCRKPAPGMLLSIKNKYGIDMRNSILIGDKVSDIEAALNAGVGQSFLVESGHKLSRQSRVKVPVYENLYYVSEWLLLQDPKKS